ncbi:MAG: GTPase Era [Solibacterales bacterium]|nr:GTPase Era [Bryobacterales bacterium]|tara:strand:+ start:6645 stop:7574 length:930 start_codon:yes stop_codon:yes gene_type:complete
MKAGLVAILGRPNVGKSTLLNRLVGTKISITANKPQTTRDAIQGIVTNPEGQIVFIDSPGIHEPRQELGKRMMREVKRATSGCSLVLVLVDGSRNPGQGDTDAIETARNFKVPLMLGLNKIDLLKSKHLLLPRIKHYRDIQTFEELVPISAQSGENVDLLVKLIMERLPEAPPFYPEDYITDQPEKFLAAEFIREKVIESTQQEVPHSVAVIVDQWTQEKPRSTKRKQKLQGLLKLSATVYVERAGQKKILVGSQGAMLKQVGSSARKQLESWFGSQVFLELFVKVQPKWREQKKFVQSLDFHQMIGGS